MLSADAALDEEGGDGEGDDAPNPFQHFADDVTLLFEEFEHGVDVVFDDVNDVWCRRMPGFLFTFAKVRHSRRAFSVFCTFVHHRVALFLFFSQGQSASMQNLLHIQPTMCGGRSFMWLVMPSASSSFL